MRRGPIRRRARVFAVLPTLLTLGNAVCGFGAITLASRGADPGGSVFAAAAALIFLAMAFDLLDGTAARWADRATPFGAQLDSLCDAISFGAAPALLVFQFCLPLGWPPRLLWPVAALYVACTVLRLARFNVEVETEVVKPRTFRGLPSPAAAGTVASFPVMVYGLGELATPGRHPAWDVLSGWLTVWTGRVLPVVTLAAACLMVSRIPYTHLARHTLRGRRSGRHVIKLVFAGAVILVMPEVSVPLLCCWYTFAPPVAAGWRRCAERVELYRRGRGPDPGGGDVRVRGE